MQIDLKHLDEGPLKLHEQLTVPVSRLDPSIAGTPMRVDVDLTARSEPPGYVIEGSIRMDGQLICGRCLGLVPWSAHETFCVRLHHACQAPAEEERRLSGDDLDVVFLEDGCESIDLEDIVAEQVGLSLPIRVLCREDCAGICPVCGANRNHPGACRCATEPDPRWQPLANLKPRSS